VEGGAVDRGEGGVGVVEEEREVGSGEEDGVELLAADELLGELSEGGELLGGAAAAPGELHIHVVDEVGLLRGCRDEFDAGDAAVEARLKNVSGAEGGDAADVAGGELAVERGEDVDEGQRGDLAELVERVVRGDGGEDGELGSGGLQAEEDFVEILGEGGGIVGLDGARDAGHVGVDHDEVEDERAGGVGVGKFLVVVDGGAYAEAPE